VGKIKYLGVHLLCNTGLTDITDSVRKFYGKFNNIMSTLGKGSNEITAFQLTKTYCLPSVLYSCEVWQLNDTNMQYLWYGIIAYVVGGRVLNPYNIFCSSLQVSHIIQQHKLLFWKKIY